MATAPLGSTAGDNRSPDIYALLGLEDLALIIVVSWLVRRME